MNRKDTQRVNYLTRNMIKLRDKYIIDTSVLDILKMLRSETALNGDMFLRDIKESGHSSVMVTCPFHKKHAEKKPACGVFLQDQASGWKEGQFHCFACGATGDLPKLVSACFHSSDVCFGEEWLIERFGNTYIEKIDYLPEIKLEKEVVSKTYLNEDILRQYDFYHPYMWYRKLSKDVVDRFRVGYDKERDAITFPVYDEKHNLVMVTARSVNSKRFWIPPNVDKPVYLLYDILERNVKTVYVAESQINALTLRTYGLDSVALFGTGSDHQYDILRKSGIRNYILLFDGDEAGQRGALRFRKNMPEDIFITDVRLPAGKDVNDLKYEELMNIISSS